MLNCSFSLQILPLNTDTDSILSIVDDVIKLIQSSNLNYMVSPFETTVEGEYSECMDLLSRCLELANEKGEDIFANIKVHSTKKERILSINEKVDKYNK